MNPRNQVGNPTVYGDQLGNIGVRNLDAGLLVQADDEIQEIHGVDVDLIARILGRIDRCAIDFTANAGGVIYAAVEYHGGTQTQALQTIEEKIRANTEGVLASAKKNGTLPRQAAVALAEARVRKAMAYQK